jgi:RNA polymerase sigma factor (sigma-70 family)
VGRITDETLIDEAGRGSEAAITELFRRHHPAAVRYARSLAKSDATAEDIAADAFMRVLKRISEGARPTALRAYLFTTVRHLFVDYIRRNPPTDSISEDAGAGTTLVSPDPTVEATERLAVESLLRLLEPNHQIVLRLAILDGLSNAEIAQALSMSPNAAASMTYRARRALQRAYWTENSALALTYCFGS